MPIALGARGHRSRRGRRLRAAAGGLGPARARAPASRRRSATPRRACRSRRAPPRDWQAAGAAAARRRAASSISSTARRRAPGARVPRPRPGRGAAPHRPRRPRRLLRGRGRRGHGRLAARARRRRTRWRTSPPPPATTSSRSPAATAATSSSSCRRTARARRRSCWRGSSRGSTSPRSTRSARSGRTSRPRRRSSPTTPATASSPIPTPAPLRLEPHAGDATADRLAALIDPAAGAAPNPRRGRRGGAPRDGLSLRRRPRPDGGVADLFDLPRLRLRPRLGALRDQLPEPRRRLHAWRRAIRTRPAAASGRCTRSSRRCCGARAGCVMPFGVMGGAYQPAGHVRLPQQPARLRHGPAGGDRRAARFPTRARCSSRRGYPTRPSRPSSRRSATGSIRRDVPLGGAQAILIDGRGADRRQRPAQGRLRARLLSAPAQNTEGWPQCRWPSRS